MWRTRQAHDQDRWPDGLPAVAGERPACDQPMLATGTWPSQFAQVLSETLAGSRPASQLTPWTTEQARKRISQLGPMLAPRGAPGGRPPRTAMPRRPRVRRVIVTSPADGVLEMTVIVDTGSRARALAVRLERSSADQMRTSDSQHSGSLRTGAAAPRALALHGRRGGLNSARSGLCTARRPARSDQRLRGSPWQSLNFLPDPHGHGSFLPTLLKSAAPAELADCTDAPDASSLGAL